MSRSSVRGKATSARKVEVLGLTPHALWLLVDEREYMLDFVNFPWFREATIKTASEIELRFEHLHWPALDVDLHLDALMDPARFPLLSRSRSSGGARVRKT